MSVPIRRPDLDALFPTRLAFDQAIEVPAPITTLQPGEGGLLQPLWGLQDLETAGIPAGWSARAMAMEMLKTLEARIVSEYEGAIDMLLLTVPKVDDAAQPGAIDPRLAGHFKSVITHFSRGVHFVIVAAPAQKKEIDRWFQKAGVDRKRVTFVSSPRFRYSVWAQDAYVTLRDKHGHIILCEGVSFPRFDDMTIADDVAAQSEIAAVPSYLFFQGGNVLGGKSLTLMGIDYIVRNATRHRLETVADAQRAFEELFGTPIVALGGKKSGDFDLLKKGILSGRQQPIFHIDMYVTPTGVIDPATQKEVVFLGRPAKAKEATGHFSDVDELDNDRYDGFFTETAGQLARHFTVKTLPLWITFGNLRNPSKPQKFYNLTWNNALVENDGKSMKRVLLPNYADRDDAFAFGFDPKIREDLQQCAEHEWREIGYDVQFTDGMEDLAWGDGAVHCMTKTLRRRTVD